MRGVHTLLSTGVFYDSSSYCKQSFYYDRTLIKLFTLEFKSKTRHNVIKIKATESPLLL